MIRVNEALSQLQYKKTADPQRLLYDFYFIVGFVYGADAKDDIKNFIIKDIAEQCIQETWIHMKQALLWSISCELYHIGLETDTGSYAYFEKNLNHFFPADTAIFLKNYMIIFDKLDEKDPQTKEDSKYLSGDRSSFISRDSSGDQSSFISRDSNSLALNYKYSYIALKKTVEKLHTPPLSVATHLERVFTDLPWLNGYGGEAWAKICNCYKNLVEADTYQRKIIYIDHAYDLQHNSDSIFDKVQSYYKDQEDLRWLKIALDWKKEAKNPVEFYEKVSPNLQPLVAWISKNIYNQTIEKVRDIENQKIKELSGGNKEIISFLKTEKGKNYIKEGYLLRVPSIDLFDIKNIYLSEFKEEVTAEVILIPFSSKSPVLVRALEASDKVRRDYLLKPKYSAYRDVMRIPPKEMDIDQLFWVTTDEFINGRAKE